MSVAREMDSDEQAQPLCSALHFISPRQLAPRQTQYSWNTNTAVLG